jgi:hypothetical protein
LNDPAVLAVRDDIPIAVKQKLQKIAENGDKYVPTNI